MSPFLARAIYWPTFGWNLLLGRILKIRHWWDEIDPCVILGARPLRSDIPVLAKSLRVSAVVNMCEEFPGPVDLYREFGIEQLWLPTTDFHVPRLEDVERGVEFIQKHASKNERVYVHCKAGRARSATVVICWLVKYRGLTLPEAQRRLIDRRPHVNSRLLDRQVVKEFCTQSSP